MNQPLGYLSARPAAIAIGAALLGIAALATVYVNSRGATAGDEPIGTADVSAAVQATAGCLEAQGLIAQIQPGAGLRLDQLSYGIPPAGGDPEAAPDPAAREKAAGCLNDYYWPVLADYEADHPVAPTEADLDALYADLARCIDEGGRPDVETGMVSAGQYEGDTRTLVIRRDQFMAWAQCATAIEAETGLLPPSPTYRD